MNISRYTLQGWLRLMSVWAAKGKQLVVFLLGACGLPDIEDSNEVDTCTPLTTSIGHANVCRKSPAQAP